VTQTLIWVLERDVLAMHDKLLAMHGGAPGLRDRGLLQSALARPQQLASYAPSSDRVQLAGAYTAGIVRNHPFVDGNKRAGFVAGVLFLELNGLRFTASEADAAQAVLDLAARLIDEETYCAFIRSNSQ
jgi:death-on-curing protein